MARQGPSRRDPFQGPAGNCIGPQAQAQLLGEVFAKKMTRNAASAGTSIEAIRQSAQKKFRQGERNARDQITEKEGELSVSDEPKRKAASPDKIPSEIYQSCPALIGPLAAEFAKTVKRNYIPKAAGRFHATPRAKPGKDPST